MFKHGTEQSVASYYRDEYRVAEWSRSAHRQHDVSSASSRLHVHCESERKRCIFLHAHCVTLFSPQILLYLDLLADSPGWTATTCRDGEGKLRQLLCPLRWHCGHQPYQSHSSPSSPWSILVTPIISTTVTPLLPERLPPSLLCQ